MKKSFIRLFMQATLRLVAFFARRPWLAPVSNFITRSLARVAVRAKGIDRADAVADLGPRWQSALLSRKQIPIVDISANTVIAEIHTTCPLRGSGDVHACHRMMEFDREVLRHAGGQLVVLESQATPGVTVCRVAMRLQGQSLDGLVPAHHRQART